MEQAPETPLKSGLYPPANAVLEVHVEVLVFFQDKYTHGKQQTRQTRGKKSSIKYLVHTWYIIS